MSRFRKFFEEDDLGDPLEGLANLFDLGMVFALALLLAALKLFHMEDLFHPNQSATWVKNPGKPNMEILIRRGKVLKRYRVSQETLQGEGTRLGVCYRLKSGEVVYVPDKPQ